VCRFEETSLSQLKQDLDVVGEGSLRRSLRVLAEGDSTNQDIIELSLLKYSQPVNIYQTTSCTSSSPYTRTRIRMAAPNILSTISRWAVPVFAAVSVGQAALYDVKGGSRAVIFDRLSGVREQVVNEGTHFLIPWLQKAIIYDVRTKPRNISTTTGSKDMQMVSLTLRVLHRPEVQNLPKIYQVSSRLVSRNNKKG